MKIKYFNEGGMEQIVETVEHEDGSITLPRGLIIPCGCEDADSSNPWAAVVSLFIIASVTCFVVWMAWK